MRHFDQSWQALASLDANFEDKLDLITVVDEYVFGYCLHERNNLKDHTHDDEMVDYIEDLLIEDEYPALSAMVAEMGMPRLWSRLHNHARSPAASIATSPACWPASRPASRSADEAIAAFQSGPAA